MEFRKNELTKNVVDTYAESFSQTCGLAEFVPQKSMKKIYDTINKNMNTDFKKADRQYKKETSSGFINNVVAFVTAPFRLFTVAHKLDKLIELLTPQEVEQQEFEQPTPQNVQDVEQPITQNEQDE